ncbi:uncharacterized protein L199_005118 [Kwoniella botswanensis]|uniref:uncharacterized protein n=1 Tax=Kwoniella botswanensis TaxID=1268659 RepID=UPI00315CCBC8
MSKGILDFPDEVLVRSARFVHQDTHIPLPSLIPHFGDFYSPIDPFTTETFSIFNRPVEEPFTPFPYEAYTCQSPNGKVLSLICQGLLASRGQLHIGSWRYSDPSSDPNYNAITMWDTLITFLSQLTSLEELVIYDLPLCFHKPGQNLIKHLPPPAGDILPSREIIIVSAKSYLLLKACTATFYSLMPIPQQSQALLVGGDLDNPQ